MMEPSVVKDFFEWLVPNLERAFDDASVQFEVGKRLDLICKDLSWEAGPSKNEGSFFAFSPNMDAKLLPITEELARAAPHVPGWVFLPAKPRKQWTTRSVEYKSPGGTRRRYQLDNWKYFLTSFKDGEFFDVNLVPDDPELAAKDSARLGTFLVASELGEKLYLLYVDRVNILKPDEVKCDLDPVEHLHNHLLQHVAPHTHH